MATLSALAQTQLQSAIDLLVKGSAYETPISEDVVQRIAPVFQELNVPTTPNGGGTTTIGGAYEVLRNNPKTALIALVAVAGTSVFTAAEINELEDAAMLMLAGTAYETPFAEDVIQRLAPVAESSNFLTRGGFYEAAKLNPVSTMLKWALQVGSV